ncbi:MAG: hypothetical protein IPK48_08450 [Gammaproteobacteria bacterium]|nr:hypothetical protein [Gammaproteobacteria bacterium]
MLLASRYRLGREAALAPYDLGIGWQRMSDSAVLRGLRLSQSARFLHWRWRDAPPIPEAERSRARRRTSISFPRAVTSRRASPRCGRGQLVSLQGRLVEASRPDGWRWRSSLSRGDSGNGACELLYVEAIDEDGGAG